MKPVVIVVKTGNCHRCLQFCKKAERLVEEDGRYDYREVNAFDDEDGRELVKRHGLKTVPAVVFDGRTVVGATIGELQAWLKAR